MHCTIFDTADPYCLSKLIIFFLPFEDGTTRVYMVFEMWVSCVLIIMLLLSPFPGHLHHMKASKPRAQ